MVAPKVSVIVPNYNHAAYLRQRLDSILNQRFRDFEIILLDDHSTDESVEILTAYRHRPEVTHLVVNEQNSGNPFLQWQRGLALAKGEWIWIAESDDYADENFLNEMLDATADQPEIGLVYCDSAIVAHNGEILGNFAALKNKKFATDRWSKAHVNKGHDEIEQYLLPEGTINNTSAVLFRRSTFLKADPFDITFRYIGDKYAFLKVLAISDVGYVPLCLNFYRDPFNKKHADRYVFYFYEQFVVFDWVKRNIAVKDLQQFYRGFHSNTQNSLFRDWNHTKVGLYRKLLQRSPTLLIRSIFRNFTRSLQSVVNRKEAVNS